MGHVALVGTEIEMDVAADLELERSVERFENEIILVIGLQIVPCRGRPGQRYGSADKQGENEVPSGIFHQCSSLRSTPMPGTKMIGRTRPSLNRMFSEIRVVKTASPE